MRYTTSLITRVALALIFIILPAALQINIFQTLFQNITLQVSYIFLKLVDSGAVVGSFGVKHAIDIFGEYTLNIVEYCVTSSAYYFLTLLAILVYDVSIIKRLGILVWGYLAIFAMNIVRILILVTMLVERGPEYFQTAHDFLGAALSIFYVIIIWILFSIASNIKSIPVITDIRILVEDITKKDEV